MNAILLYRGIFNDIRYDTFIDFDGKDISHRCKITLDTDTSIEVSVDADTIYTTNPGSLESLQPGQTGIVLWRQSVNKANNPV